jgi:acetyl esterase/lipase
MRICTVILGCFSLLISAPVARGADADMVPVPRGVAYIPDVTYWLSADKKTHLELDVAYPSKGDETLPALVFFHGGGWVAGTRKNMTPYMLRAAQEGYVAVAVSYRLGAPFPTAPEDARAAIRWLRSNAGKYRIDPKRIGAVGYSAGGQLACLLGSDEEKGAVSSRVQAVASWYAITDLEALLNTKQPLLAMSLKSYLPATADERKAVAIKASPIRHVHKQTAPTFLIHGAADSLVPVEQSRAYAARCKEVGAEATVEEVEDADHNFTGAAEQAALKKMMAFFDEHLKPQGRSR